jgi:hypothetical protein
MSTPAHAAADAGGATARFSVVRRAPRPGEPVGGIHSAARAAPCTGAVARPEAEGAFVIAYSIGGRTT